MSYTIYRGLYYTTFTILGWNKLLNQEKNIKIILDALDFLVNQNRFTIYSFVIMPNHIHIVYQLNGDITNGEIKHSFLGYTAKKILANMTYSEKAPFLVNKLNRNYQIWKSPSLSVGIESPNFLIQKISYIHNNPHKAGLVEAHGLYKWSSLRSYETGEVEYNFLTLF